MARVHAAVLALLGAAAWSTACYPQHQCDATTSSFTGGEMADPDHYETTPFDDPKRPWLDYPGNTTVVVTFPEDVVRATAGRGISGIMGYISQSANLSDPGNQIVQAVEQNAAYSDFGPLGFTVTNQTCQADWARFVVTFYSADAGTPIADAQAE